MKSLGLIVEYNPFHNGHKYHLEKSKEITNAEVVIGIMSSNFIQRGEPSLVNKWGRTKMALENGIDLIIELPSFYSNQSAEIFSLGAVSLLDKLKVESLVFGSESGDINYINNIAKVFHKNKEELDEKISSLMKKGISYPNAVNNAIENITGIKDFFSPNNILGLEYLKAIKKTESKIKPYTIKRIDSKYHSQETTGDISSATAIRNHLQKNELGEISNTLPKYNFDLLLLENSKGRVRFLEDYFEILKYKIISNKAELYKIQDMEVGFENRLYNKILESKDLGEFLSKIITKRYTYARIKRILTHIIIDLDEEITEIAKRKLPPYIRILGMNKIGRQYLNKVKKKIETPILTNLSNLENVLDEEAIKLLNFEIKASNIYSILNNEIERKIPIILESDK